MTKFNGPRSVGPWTIEHEETVYDNPWIRIVDHQVKHPDGSPGQYGVVRFKNLAIGILAIDAEGNVPLVGQHRFPHDNYSWEVPEGGGPLGDDPLVSARRELREETGYLAANWQEIASFDVSNSVTDERSVCFLAWGLESGAPEPEASEDFAYEHVSFFDLHERVLRGEIRDALTIIMVLKAATLARTGRLPSDLLDMIG